MTDSKHSEHHAPERAPIDSEIDVRRAVEVGLWLGGTTIGALVIGYFLYLGLSKWTTGADPAPAALAEAGRNLLPPAPNLQVQPEKELAAMRAAERERLTTWGWTDKSLGLAHMPIEEAIDRLAVPEPAAPPAAAAPTPAAPAAADPHAAEAAPAPAHEGTVH
ncbi:MAG: hypothetical protein KBA72_04625 [Thermoanaerobaculia bacterium]|nr:hypothetical protein [Thermoanaerobaculia bacterium]